MRYDKENAKITFPNKCSLSMRMTQLKGFWSSKNFKKLICWLQESIYGSSKLIRVEYCVYMKVSGSAITFFSLYVDDIFLIRKLITNERHSTKNILVYEILRFRSFVV